MGLFTTGCRIENLSDPTKGAVIPRMLVDSGATARASAAAKICVRIQAPKNTIAPC